MPKKLRFKHDGTRLEKERKKGRKKGEGKRDGGALRVSDHVLPTIQLTRDTLGLLESLGETLSRAKPPTDIPFASSPPQSPFPAHKADPKCLLSSSYTSCKNITNIRIAVSRGRREHFELSPYRSSRPTRDAHAAGSNHPPLPFVTFEFKRSRGRTRRT